MPCHPHPAARCARVHPPRRRGGIPGVPRSGFCFVFFAALAGLTGVAGFVFFAALAGLVGFVVDIGFVADVSLVVLAKGLQELKVLDSFEDVALRPVVAVMASSIWLRRTAWRAVTGTMRPSSFMATER